MTMTPVRYWLYFLLCGFLSALAASFVWIAISMLVVMMTAGGNGLGLVVFAALIASIFGGIIGLPVTLAGGAIMRFAEMKWGWTHWIQWMGCGLIIGSALSSIWYLVYTEGVDGIVTFAIGSSVGALVFRYFWHLKVKVGTYNERQLDEELFG